LRETQEKCGGFQDRPAHECSVGLERDGEIVTRTDRAHRTKINWNVAATAKSDKSAINMPIHDVLPLCVSHFVFQDRIRDEIRTASPDEDETALD
jgi:hypothetical protein